MPVTVYIYGRRLPVISPYVCVFVSSAAALESKQERTVVLAEVGRDREGGGREVKGKRKGGKVRQVPPPQNSE